MRRAQPGDWKAEPLPEARRTVTRSRRVSAAEMARIEVGLIPQEMEDQWFIYVRSGTLYFHRSWTGNCIYAVRFAPEGEGFRMVAAEVNRDPAQYQESDDARDVRLIDDLVDLLLLRRPAAFPDDASPEQRALKAWAPLGRAMSGQNPDERERG